MDEKNTVWSTIYFMRKFFTQEENGFDMFFFDSFFLRCQEYL